jgi:RNA polymerase sigma-70 factor (ECF subfamily)
MERSTMGFLACSDADLIRAARSDPLAFEALFERHAMVLRQWLFAQTGDAGVAQDLLAETFAEAWRGVRRFRGEDERSGGAWLYGIARHLVHQHYRRGRVERSARRRLGMATATVTDGGIDELPGRIDARELSAEVREAFATLTPDQQRAIGYRIVEQFSFEEVAAQLGCNTTTARTRVLRGLQALRTAIGKGDQL